MKKTVALIVLAGAVIAAACDGLGQAMTAHRNVVARAAGHELTVDETASLLALNPRLPAQADVVEAVANLWVDYILLASAATEDTALATVNLDPIIRPYVEQRMFTKLRDQGIPVDTALTDEELRAIYEDEQPELQVRARHILLRVSADATAAERDSVRTQAEELQARAAGSADFAALAREFSEDPGSANQGGDLGFFGPGSMVKPFEDAAFALDVGEVSPVVETPFGYHIIKVEERRLPQFSEVKDTFRAQVIEQRQAEAVQSYLEQLTEPLDIEVQDGAYDVARELAENPDVQLGGRAAGRALVSYKGGALTAQEYLDLMRRFPPNQRARYAMASDDQLEPVLTGLTQNEILVREAQRLGLQVSAAERDSIEAEARRQLRLAATAAGFTGIEPQAGETLAQAIERKVNSLLESILKGEQELLPLGALAYSLREDERAEVLDRAFPTVVARVEAARPALATPDSAAPATGPAAPAADPPAPSADPTAPTPADTTQP